VIKPASAELTDEAVVRAVAAGDREALHILNQRYGNALAVVAERILGDRADAEEIAADVLWQVWRQAETYNRARGSVGAWLMTVVRSRAIDRLRSRNARASAHERAGDEAGAHGAADPVADLHSAELRRAVAAAMAKLHENERAVLELAYFSDLSQSIIAERTGLPLGTVKSRIRSALLKLREGLQQFGR
jgi:RNA polymerase sigma-70 factor (ECF subfamily)